MLRLPIVLFALAFLSACAADPATRPPALAPHPSDLTTESIAARLENALTSTPAIHLTERSYQDGRPGLVAESWMTRNAVRTDVSRHGKVVYSMAVRGNAAEELIPAGATADGVSGPRYERFSVKHAYWLDFGTLVSVPWMCPVGDTSGSWLADRDMIDTLCPRIATGELLGLADLEGHPCAAVRWTHHQGEPHTRSWFAGGFTYYVDLDRGWILRSDGFQETSSDRIERVALYQIEPADPPLSKFVLRAKSDSAR